MLWTMDKSMKAHQTSRVSEFVFKTNDPSPSLLPSSDYEKIRYYATSFQNNQVAFESWDKSPAAALI